jgi:hypothetical protein
MKSVLAIWLVALASGLSAQDPFYKFSFYANGGQALPVGALKAKNTSGSPLEVGLKDPFGQSYAIGFDVFFNKWLGIAVGSSIHRLGADKQVFETMQSSMGNRADSYLRDYNFYSSHVGLKSRLIYKRFAFEPGFSIGINSLDVKMAEVYILGTNNNINRIIHYSYGYGAIPAYITSMNIFCRFLEFKYMKIGIHALAEFSYMNPSISETITTSDRIAEQITVTQRSYHQPFTIFYYGIGLSLKYGHLRHPAGQAGPTGCLD